MDVKKVTVLGGGSAGWLTALFLQKNWPILDITVIEDPLSQPIIAGESSTAPFIELLDFLQIDFEEWIKKVDALPKYGGKFSNWSYSNFIQPLFSYYRARWNSQYPEFGNNNDLLKAALVSNFPLHKLSVSGFLIEKNKSHILNDNCVLRPMYHFDSRKNSDFFKQEGIKKGIKLIESKFSSCVIKDGSIDYLQLEDFDIKSDFYFDCSGFSQLLLKKSLKENYVDFSGVIKTNSVLAWWEESDHCPFTDITALNYGWKFKIDLRSRSGNGYIYDGDLISIDDAKKEIEDYIGKSITPIASLKWKPLVTLSPWCSNVIAIGLSTGFLEPLGSPGHTLIALQLRLLSEYWNCNSNSYKIFRQNYNRSYSKLVLDTVDFINLHYQTNKNKTVFWKNANNSITTSLNDKLLSWSNGNFQEDVGAYSIENYAVVLQAYDKLNKDMLLKILQSKGDSFINTCYQELIRLSSEGDLISNNCLDIKDWVNHYD